MKHKATLILLAPALLALAACGKAVTGAVGGVREVATAGRLALAVKSAETGADGHRCTLNVMAHNDTGAAALNVQAAWMAQTEGFGIISDYQVLGDFAADEARPLQLGIFGAPCNAVRHLKLTRAVCVVGPAEDPPESCAGRVVLDGGGVVVIRSE